jgi:hypothetical protein
VYVHACVSVWVCVCVTARWPRNHNTNDDTVTGDINERSVKLPSALIWHIQRLMWSFHSQCNDSSTVSHCTRITQTPGEHVGLFGCCAIWSARSLSTFQRCSRCFHHQHDNRPYRKLCSQAGLKMFTSPFFYPRTGSSLLLQLKIYVWNPLTGSPPPCFWYCVPYSTNHMPTIISTECSLGPQHCRCPTPC